MQLLFFEFIRLLLQKKLTAFYQFQNMELRRTLPLNIIFLECVDLFDGISAFKSADNNLMRLNWFFFLDEPNLITSKVSFKIEMS